MIQYWSKLSHSSTSINLEEIEIANSFTGTIMVVFSFSIFFSFLFFNKQGNTLKELIRALWLLLYLYEYECPIFRHSFRFLFRICFYMNLILSFCSLLLSRPYSRVIRCRFCLYSHIWQTAISMLKTKFFRIVTVTDFTLGSWIFSVKRLQITFRNLKNIEKKTLFITIYVYSA